MKYYQVLSSFEAAAERKGAFLVASEELAASARAAAKVFYVFAYYVIKLQKWTHRACA
jgi:hypothetical protein